MHILKFGGSSIKNVESIKQVETIVEAYFEMPKGVIVFSAIAGVTDKLILSVKRAVQNDLSYQTVISDVTSQHIEIVKLLMPISKQSHVLSAIKVLLNEAESLLDAVYRLNEASPKVLDHLMSYGERLSSLIIFNYLEERGEKVALIDVREFIKTDATYGDAQVDFVTSRSLIQNAYNSNKNWLIVPGFIGTTAHGDFTTLGRGGSDYSASIVADALDAEILEIWTDVDGLLTADPRLVPEAKVISNISFDEAMEMSHFGAKVIFPPSLQPVATKRIPVRIKNTFAPENPGTLILKNDSKDQPVTGTSGISNIALITICGPGMIGVPGIASRLFGSLATAKINVVFITQSSSEHSISVGINESQLIEATKILSREFSIEISKGTIEPPICEESLAIVALIGDGMKNHHGISGRLFSALGRYGINVRAISQGSTERNISIVVKERDKRKALNVIHDAFFSPPLKQLNLFIAGLGNVGSRLLEQIQHQEQWLGEELGLRIRIFGLANSKNRKVSKEPFSLVDWQNELQQQEEYKTLTEWQREIINMNMRNSVFVDNSASQEVSFLYKNFLKHGIAVVTCNKIACSSLLSDYQELKYLSKLYKAPFLFETNVGAGLPVINTLKDLIRSGDRILRIEAVLSGSLNFIFNQYDSTKPFADIVLEAMQQGYTEPDPRMDLSGLDVIRKLIILARESGASLEQSDVKHRGFIPNDIMNAATIEDFIRKLYLNEDLFKEIYLKSRNNSTKLKVVAKWSEEGATTSLEEIPLNHPFYNLEGKDNVVLYYTKRYQDQPLMIKGAGAGAEVTASGIFADIIRTLQEH